MYKEMATLKFYTLAGNEKLFTAHLVLFLGFCTGTRKGIHLECISLKYREVWRLHAESLENQ